MIEAKVHEIIISFYKGCTSRTLGNYETCLSNITLREIKLYPVVIIKYVFNALME